MIKLLATVDEPMPFIRVGRGLHGGEPDLLLVPGRVYDGDYALDDFGNPYCWLYVINGCRVNDFYVREMTALELLGAEAE